MIRAAVLAALVAGPALAQGTIESQPLAPLQAPSPRAPLTPGGVLPPADPFSPQGAVGAALNPLVVTEPLPVDDSPSPPAVAAPPGDPATARVQPAEPAVAALPDPAKPDPRFRRAPPGLPQPSPGATGTPGIAIPGAPAPDVPVQLIAPIDTALAPGATLRELDKITGRIRTFDLAAGAETQVDRLRIKVLGCRAPDDNGTRGTMAFLQIWDVRRNDGPPDFSGWMFAESPALSALDHPRYDVWVLGCAGLAAPSAPSTPAPVAPPDDSGAVTED